MKNKDRKHLYMSTSNETVNQEKYNSMKKLKELYSAEPLFRTIVDITSGGLMFYLMLYTFYVLLTQH